jgi:hypothetical protein
MASETDRFKRQYTDLHIGNGFSINENVPEKHCKNN